MNDQTETITPTTDPDPFAATVKRWSWQNDGSYAASLDASRDRAGAFGEALAELARLLAARNLPAPTVEGDWSGAVLRASWYVDDLAGARIVRRAIGSPFGPWEKQTTGGRLSIACSDSRLRLRIAVSGDTCEAVETGETETIQQTVDVCPVCEQDLVDLDSGGKACSDPGCVYETRPPKQVTRTVEQPKIEWRCPDINGEVDR